MDESPSKPRFQILLIKKDNKRKLLLLELMINSQSSFTLPVQHMGTKPINLHIIRCTTSPNSFFKSFGLLEIDTITSDRN